MGTYFIALMGYQGLTERVGTALDLLEQYPTRVVLQKLGINVPADFESNEQDTRHPVWDWTGRAISDYSNDTTPRPVLPNLWVPLYLPEGWRLTFGSDTIHAFRFGPTWNSFLAWYEELEEIDNDRRYLFTEPLTALCELFGVTDCIFAHDKHVVEDAFFDGLTYQDILQLGEPVPLNKLYDDLPDHARPAFGNLVPWPRERPLPEGWERPRALSYTKYWRLPLNK